MKKTISPFVFSAGFIIALATIQGISPRFLRSQEGLEPPSVTGEQTPFEAFEIILKRNIFDPNRRTSQRVERPEPTPGPDPDEAVLSGTMITEQKAYAFFQGSNSDLRAVVSVGNSYLGYQVRDILTSKVILENEDQRLEVPVGMALTKEEGDDWKLTAPSANIRREFASSRGSSERSSPSTRRESGSSGNDEVQNDVLKRLMEQRRQEIEQ